MTSPSLLLRGETRVGNQGLDHSSDCWEPRFGVATCVSERLERRCKADIHHSSLEQPSSKTGFACFHFSHSSPGDVGEVRVGAGSQIEPISDRPTYERPKEAYLKGAVKTDNVLERRPSRATGPAQR